MRRELLLGAAHRLMRVPQNAQNLPTENNIIPANFAENFAGNFNLRSIPQFRR